VHNSQIIGNLTDPFGEFKEQIKSPSTGYVVGLNNNPVVNAGDALMHLGMDDVCKIGGSSEE
jgi:predicted deacylase